jgi:hypothetical protein
MESLNEIKIEQGIPMDPWAIIINKMKQGDSCFFTSDKERQTISRSAKRMGVLTQSKRWEENGVQGFRVWHMGPIPKRQEKK